MQHNYLYYSHQLDAVTGGVEAIQNRMGLVNTVGAQGALIFNTHVKNKKTEYKELGKDDSNVHHIPFDLSHDEDTSPEGKRNWLGLHYGMTDEDGYLVNYDGSRSFVVHQYDRLGFHYTDWIGANKRKFYL